MDTIQATPGEVKQVQAIRGLPFCKGCGLHIGTGAAFEVCGACRRWRRSEIALNLAELMKFARLVRKHWGNGNPRTLLIGAGNYRPTLYTTLHPRMMDGWTLAERQEQVTACAERAELADLYDRIQYLRGDGRRACRS